ncbi:hypothetical protein FBEOM_14221 [Fusarium beomiforme]|uniref:HEAT repeat domain-containing protein n=1 Tax=Fusarium beomiforme TaxID=44412 RepID=A0A9P5DRQ5_9HYPO|nr:hypothetical protein FBEOM_14221 [Fusarium beomiforme]
MSNSAGPLESIDSIDWSELEHAYGTAEDVPQLLRDLHSSDPEIRETAHDDCWSMIFHQGTRYSASAAAVPFLYSILNHPDTKSRRNLLFLIVSLAVGYTEHVLPKGIDVAEWEEHIENQDDEEMQEHMMHEFETYEAVEEGLPNILRYLEEEEPQIRIMAAYALAFFPRRSDTSVTALFERLGREINSSVRGTIVLAIAVLYARVDNGTRKKDIIQKLQRSYAATKDDELFGWSCALSLVILGATEADIIEKARRALNDEVYLTQLEGSIDPDAGFTFGMPELRDLAKAVLESS